MIPDTEGVFIGFRNESGSATLSSFLYLWEVGGPPGVEPGAGQLIGDADVVVIDSAALFVWYKNSIMNFFTADLL